MPAAKVPRARKSRLPRGSALQPVPSAVLVPMERPEPPDGLSDGVMADWLTFWDSPQAAHVTQAHLPALRRLFLLRHQRELFARVGLDEPTSEGSTGQLVLSPLIKHIPVLDTAILALEDRFGLSPKASITLQGEFDDATSAAAKANEALSAGFAPPSEPKPVRRLAAVE